MIGERPAQLLERDARVAEDRQAAVLGRVEGRDVDI
jgi:hypothetical protein